MKILALATGHDASASVIEEGKIIFHSQEERLSGIKHNVGLPLLTLDQIHKDLKINFKSIDAITMAGLGTSPQIDLLFGINPKIYLKGYSKPQEAARGILIKLIFKLIHFQLGGKLSFPLYEQKNYSSKKVPIIYVDHHLSHAASAYYTSGFDNCLVITADGQGDFLSQTIWLGRQGKLEPIIKIGREGSLGFFYGIVTEGLGWQINEGEGKTMGLAPYGNYKKTYKTLDFITPFYRDGKLVKPKYYGFLQGWERNGVVHIHFDESRKVKELARKYGPENIAAEAQRVLEEQMINFIVPWIKKFKVEKVAAAGGIFLNVKMNQKIWETGLLKDFYIYPDAGDSGAGPGAALYVYHNYFKKKYDPCLITNMYLGQNYEDEEILKILKIRNLKYKKFINKQTMVKMAAKLLSDDKIIAWFQGKMESGPRALGNRSILMSPMKAENKDIINAKVKYREAFRPFCPSMTEEAARKYLVNPTPFSEFMIISFDVKEEYRNEIPAVVHVDGTTRPQVVTKYSNPLFHQLITQFGKLTGTPVLINTSFNIKGYPMVCKPEDAIKCFYDTGLDYLFIGSFMLEK